MLAFGRELGLTQQAAGTLLDSMDTGQVRSRDWREQRGEVMSSYPS